MNREEKARVIEELAEKLKGGSVVFVDYKGMNVAQSTRLRARSRESGVEFVVAKNTLTQRAANQAGVEGISEYLVGPTALALSEDPVVSAKLMAEFSDEIGTFELKGGLLDGDQVVDVEGVVALSRLPEREQLIAQVVGGIQSPIAGLVNVLNSTISAVGNTWSPGVLNQVAEQKGS